MIIQDSPMFRKCGACGMSFVLIAESTIPRHECPTRVPRCDSAIKQDNPDGNETETGGRLVRQIRQVMYTSASDTGFSYLAFTPSALDTLNELAKRTTRTDDEERDT